MYPNLGIPKIINFIFGANGKWMVISVPILMHFTVTEWCNKHIMRNMQYGIRHLTASPVLVNRACYCLAASRRETYIQSTRVISKSKRPSEILRDIRTSTYQMCRTEENTNWTTKFLNWTCNLSPFVRNICWNIVENVRNCSWGAISLLIHNILLPDVRFLC